NIDLVATQDIKFTQTGIGVQAGATSTATLTAGRNIAGSGSGPDVKSQALTATATNGAIGVTNALSTQTTGQITLTSGGVAGAGDISIKEANPLNTNRLSVTTLATGTPDKTQNVSIETTDTGTGLTIGAAIGNADDNLKLSASGQAISGTALI